MAEVKGIMFYFNYREPLNNLSMEERGQLLTALLDYGNNGILPDFNGSLKMIFDCIKPTVDTDIEKYKNRCQRNKENISKRYERTQSNTTEYDRIQSNVNKIKENKINKNKIKNNTLVQIDKQFNAFWNAYPKKKGKQSAEKAFKKIAPDEALCKIMLNALEEQKQSAEWQKDSGQFIPHPATWLNGKRWEDEIGVKVYQQEPKDEFRIGEYF